MRNDQALIDLTNKFLTDFFALSKEIDRKDGFHVSVDDNFSEFNFRLPEVLMKCDIPRYDEEHLMVLGMASFDTEITKEFANLRAQGFIDKILKRIKNTKDQEDYIVENIVKTNGFVDDIEFFFEWEKEGKLRLERGEPLFANVKTKSKKVTFDVSNIRSGFKGNVEINWKYNKYLRKFIIEDVNFFSKGNKVMTIENKIGVDNEYHEDVTIHHFKYVADINSFYLLLG